MKNLSDTQPTTEGVGSLEMIKNYLCDRFLILYVPYLMGSLFDTLLI